MGEPWLDRGYDMNDFRKEMDIAKRLKELITLKKKFNMIRNHMNDLECVVRANSDTEYYMDKIWELLGEQNEQNTGLLRK